MANDEMSLRPRPGETAAEVIARVEHAAQPKRTILIHLNVELPADDPRPAQEVIDYVEAALQVGLEGGPAGPLDCEIALAEEV